MQKLRNAISEQIDGLLERNELLNNFVFPLVQSLSCMLITISVAKGSLLAFLAGLVLFLFCVSWAYFYAKRIVSTYPNAFDVNKPAGRYRRNVVIGASGGPIVALIVSFLWVGFFG